MKKNISLLLLFLFLFLPFFVASAYDMTKKDEELVKTINNRLYNIIEERKTITPVLVEKTLKKLLKRDLTERVETLLIKIIKDLNNKYWEVQNIEETVFLWDAEKLMKENDIPALSVLVFKNDKVLYEKQIWKSNKEKNINLKEDDLFLLASISKTITATALLSLFEKWEFELDDAINDYLSFEVNHPFYETPITFRMLLTHSSGIADWSALDNQYYYSEDSPVKLSYFMENYFTPGREFYSEEENFHDFEPWTENEYSNEWSALIGLLVEEISWIWFNEYCKKNIFEPLGMGSTFWRLDEIIQNNIVKPYEELEAVENYTFTDYPNWWLRSNTKDMSYFLQIFTHKDKVDDYKILKKETIKQVLKPQIPNISEDMWLHMFHINKDKNLWGHDGWEKWASTIMAINPGTEVWVIILTNQSDVELDRILEKAYDLWIELDSD